MSFIYLSRRNLQKVTIKKKERHRGVLSYRVAFILFSHARASWSMSCISSSVGGAVSAVCSSQGKRTGV